MPSRRGATLLLTILAGSTILAAQQGATTFRATVETVSIFATVAAPDGRLVTALSEDQFALADNGRPQTLTTFDAAPKPIHLVVMLDTSGSMTGNLPVLRAATVQLFTRLLPDDRARVGHFGDQIHISTPFTNDVDQLIRAMWLDVQPGGPTPLWTAVNAAMIELAPVDARRVVVVLSDGKDNQSKVVAGYQMGPSLEDVIALAHREEVMIYAIGMTSLDVAADALGARSILPAAPDRRPQGPDPGLKQLAAETGGGYFELMGTENLGDVFARVADELHCQYLLAYALPAADGRTHRVEVKLADKNLTVRARRSYVAPKR